MAKNSRLFPAALTLVLAGGCAALAHELLWTRRLIDLLGASSASSTRVFSCFFFGLAMGAAVTPRLIRRLRRPWRAAGLAEAGVALMALPAYYLPVWSGWIWPTLGTERLIGWQGAAVKLALSLIVVFPPAFCMGMALPLTACALLRDRFELARHGVWLYAVNTLGGVVGLVLVSLFTLHRIGADGSMQLAMLINVAVAAGCLLLDLKQLRGGAGTGPNADASPAIGWAVFGPALAVATISGGGILGFEVIALQLVALSAPLSFYAPAAVLTSVILLLGVAALIVPWLWSVTGDAGRVVFLGLLGTALLMAISPLCFYQLAHWAELGPREALWAFLAVLSGVTLAGLGPTLLVAGLVFPALLAWFAQKGEDRYGSQWGWLLAANGLGGLLGAEVTYRLLLPATGVYQAVGAVAVFYALAAAGWAWSQRPRPGRQLAMALVVVAAALLLARGPLSWLPQLDSQGIVILDEQNGREGLVAVVESPKLGRRIIMSNQYVLGGTKLRYDQERLAHVPLVLHPDPRRVMFIGLATGITPGAALEHPSVESLTSVELSPLVVRAADQYFGPFNHEITRSDRGVVIVEDARTYLAAAPGEFDVVVGDLLLPWAAGEARLYSFEHFRSARNSLREGGVFCQWLAAYQLTPAHVDVIRDTFCRVFPRAYVFRGTFDCRYPVLAFVGFRDGMLDWSTIRARCDALRGASDVHDPLARHVEGLAMLYLGTTQDGGGPVNTLSNMRVELAAGRDRVTRPALRAYLSGEAWLQFVADRYLDRFDTPSVGDLDLFKLAWLGQRLSFLEAVRQFEGPLSSEDRDQFPRIQREVQRDFPPAFRADQDADWSRFPGDASLWLTPP